MHRIFKVARRSRERSVGVRNAVCMIPIILTAQDQEDEEEDVDEDEEDLMLMGKYLICASRAYCRTIDRA